MVISEEGRVMGVEGREISVVRELLQGGAVSQRARSEEV